MMPLRVWKPETGNIWPTLERRFSLLTSQCDHHDASGDERRPAICCPSRCYSILMLSPLPSSPLQVISVFLVRQTGSSESLLHLDEGAWKKIHEGVWDKRRTKYQVKEGHREVICLMLFCPQSSSHLAVFFFS